MKYSCIVLIDSTSEWKYVPSLLFIFRWIIFYYLCSKQFIIFMSTLTFSESIQNFTKLFFIFLSHYICQGEHFKVWTPYIWSHWRIVMNTVSKYVWVFDWAHLIEVTNRNDMSSTKYFLAVKNLLQTIVCFLEQSTTYHWYFVNEYKFHIEQFGSQHISFTVR